MTISEQYYKYHNIFKHLAKGIDFCHILQAICTLTLYLLTNNNVYQLTCAKIWQATFILPCLVSKIHTMYAHNETTSERREPSSVTQMGGRHYFISTLTKENSY